MEIDHPPPPFLLRQLEPQVSYSAVVTIRLELSGVVLDVAQVGRDSLILREPYEAPPGPARVVITIDGRERVWDVNLPQGIAGREVEIVDL